MLVKTRGPGKYRKLFRGAVNDKRLITTVLKYLNKRDDGEADYSYLLSLLLRYCLVIK